MSSSEVVIRASGLGKCYSIYDSPRDRLKQFVMPRARRALGFAPKQYYREFWALRDVDFEVRRGETFGIVGRNGSGKSTLLQLLCGTLPPTLGEVSIAGRVAALLELGAGFNPEFSGRENVYMNGQVLGLSREQVDARFDAIAAFADIGDFIEQPVKTYSSGMYVRLAFAVVAHVDADILVVDEALSVGDAYFVQKCMRFLRGFMERGTLLFVSHDVGAVLNLCSRAILLERGRLTMSGAPKRVTEHYLASLYDEIRGEHAAGASNPVEPDAPASPETGTQAAETTPGGTVTAGAANDAGVHRIADAGPAAPSERDVRADLIDRSTLRNDIEVFRFQPDARGFGTRQAMIASARLTDEHGQPLAWVVGGEIVRLEIRCDAREPIDSPIVGFLFKDRLGQTIFGDNTYLSYRDDAPRVPEGGSIVATFEFRMPVLPVGDYSLSIALADGTQEAHVQHHWIHEALIVRAHASATVFGLVGVPMRRITLEAA
ncbi:MAG: ABC transporter ATP-binding protein [Burkholderiales bacterium]|jgi:lipopolysaccharide transport system ATP-binding protein